MKPTASQLVRALSLALLIAGFASAAFSQGIEEIHMDNSSAFHAAHLGTSHSVDSERGGEFMGSFDLNSLGAFDQTDSANDGSHDQKPIDEDTIERRMQNMQRYRNRTAESKDTGLLGYDDLIYSM